MRFFYLIILMYCFKSFAQNVDYTKFSGKPVKIDQIAQLNTPYFLDYISSQSIIVSNITSVIVSETAEKIVSDINIKLLQENTKDSIKTIIKLQSKLSFNYQENLISIIKYKIEKVGLLSEIRIVQTEKKDNKWRQIKLDKFEKIETVFKTLTTNAFWQFYMKSNNPQYPEINKLKPLVKDRNGILNINKLAKFVSENRESLKPLLE